MTKRNLLLAIATATLLMGSSYAVLADGAAQSSYSTHTVGTAGSGGVASTYSGGGNQTAQSTGTGGAAAGTNTSGGAVGVAGSIYVNRLGEGSGSAVLGVAKGNGYAWAKGGYKPHKPRTPPGFAGGASPLSCTLKVSDFWKWRKLDRQERQLALNCECLTLEPTGLAPSANKECPVNATEIFTATRN